MLIKSGNDETEHLPNYINELKSCIIENRFAYFCLPLNNSVESEKFSAMGLQMLKRWCG